VDASARLLPETALEATAVVANSTMNRERGLRGVNSYTRELGFDPLAVLTARSGTRWLDLCCGEGRALVEAAGELARRGRTDVGLVGVDLVDRFDAGAADHGPGLELIGASVADWSPPGRFDLVTCVHGLHYVGDRLGLLARAASWLTPCGRLVADFEPAAVRLADGRPAGRRLTAALRDQGFLVDTRRHRLTLEGPREITLPYRFVGADPDAGPNYTGQPAVHAYYDEMAV
jgi:SAM-dependent methyltransferase